MLNRSVCYLTLMKRERVGLSTHITTLMLFFGLFLIGLAYYLKATEIPAPSYPAEEWEFLWFKYTEDSQDPWGAFIEKSHRSEWNFEYNYSTGEVADTGEFELVGLRASRTLKVSSKTKYRFKLGSDDGIRLFIYSDDFEKVTQMTTGWIDRAYTEHSYQRVLNEGEYKILLEWYENTDNAQIKFNIIIID